MRDISVSQATSYPPKKLLVIADPAVPASPAELFVTAAAPIPISVRGAMAVEGAERAIVYAEEGP